MNQDKLPLYEALLAYKNKNPNSFHVPGHKNGLVFPKQAEDLYRSLLSIDVTELTGLDDLHYPSGVIKEAEDLAADLYGSNKCFFLVGGSTVGNLAMIMATCKEGDTVLVQRNCHKSIINGLKLAKVRPIFIQPDFDFVAQLVTGLNESFAIEMVKYYYTAKALILTRPNYYGYTTKIDEIISIAHQFNMVVLVDEAHGAHFGHRSELLPKSAIHSGADIVVQSAHKTLPAMTMCSYLHFNSQLVDIKKVKYYLQVFQSSSPSYPLMASLDLSRYYLAMLTNAQLQRTLLLIEQFQAALNEIPQLMVIRNNQYVIDPLKITVQSMCDLSGFQLQKLLEEENIFTELADANNVLFVMPLTITIDLLVVVEKIKQKLKDFKIKNKIVKIDKKFFRKETGLEISYEERESLEIEVVSLEQSVGKVTAEEIIPYPPGIPLLLDGEKIETAHLEQLYRLKSLGAYFQGTDVFQNGLKVYKN